MMQSEAQLSRLLDATIFLEEAPWPFIRRRAKEIRGVLELEIVRRMKMRRMYELGNTVPRSCE